MTGPCRSATLGVPQEGRKGGPLQTMGSVYTAGTPKSCDLLAISLWLACNICDINIAVYGNEITPKLQKIKDNKDNYWSKVIGVSPEFLMTMNIYNGEIKLGKLSLKKELILRKRVAYVFSSQPVSDVTIDPLCVPRLQEASESTGDTLPRGPSLGCHSDTPAGVMLMTHICSALCLWCYQLGE